MTTSNQPNGNNPSDMQLRLGSAFDPWQLHEPCQLAAAEVDEWVITVAARRAGHLRQIASRLRARAKLQTASISCDVLHPVFHGPALDLPTWMAGCGSLVANRVETNDSNVLSLDVRDRDAGQKRMAQRATRGWRLAPAPTQLQPWLASTGTPLKSLGVDTQQPLIWLKAFSNAPMKEPNGTAFFNLRRMAAGRSNLRFLLAGDSAVVLEAFARHIEMTHHLPVQPAIWFDRPKGWLHLEAYNLTKMLFWHRVVKKLFYWCWTQPAPVKLDLLAPIAHLQETAWPVEVRAAVALLRERIQRIAHQRGVAWTQARLSLWNQYSCTHFDDTWLHWQLETLEPFARLDSWVNDAADLYLEGDQDWVPIEYWDTISNVQRGPDLQLGWFENTEAALHWRGNGFAQRLDRRRKLLAEHYQSRQKLVCQCVDIDSPQVPETIRAWALPLFADGIQLWRCPYYSLNNWLLPERIVVRWELRDLTGKHLRQIYEEDAPLAVDDNNDKNAI